MATWKTDPHTRLTWTEYPSDSEREAIVADLLDSINADRQAYDAHLIARERLRQSALEAIGRGLSTAAVAKLSGVTHNTVKRWALDHSSD